VNNLIQLFQGFACKKQILQDVVACVDHKILYVLFLFLLRY